MLLSDDIGNAGTTWLLMSCLYRCVASLICYGVRLISMVSNSTSWCRNGEKRQPPNGSSGACFVRVRCRAGSSSISFAATRQRSPTSPNWLTSNMRSSRQQPARTIGPRIAINLRVNASGAFAASVPPNGLRRFGRASGRSGSTSRLSEICCALRSTAKSSLSALPRGIVAPSSRKIRHLSEHTHALCSIVSSTSQRDNTIGAALSVVVLIWREVFAKICVSDV